jgi:hypothetical protein
MKPLLIQRSQSKEGNVQLTQNKEILQPFGYLKSEPLISLPKMLQENIRVYKDEKMKRQQDITQYVVLQYITIVPNRGT